MADDPRRGKIHVNRSVYPTSIDSHDNLYDVEDNVHTYFAKHHNALKDAIIAIEQVLGTTGNFNFLEDMEAHALSGAYHTGDLAYTQIDSIVATTGGGDTSTISRSDHTHTGSDGSSKVDHADLVNTHNLTTDIDHNQITNTHNLTTDIDHDQLTNYVAAEHVSLPNTIANVLSDHTKANHDSLGLDHGALTGRDDDDHTIYLKADGTRALSGNLNLNNNNINNVATLTAKNLDLADGLATPSQILSIVPDTALSSSGSWYALNVNGSALDPTTGSVSVNGVKIDFSDVDLTQSPNIQGLFINMPASYSGSSMYAARFYGNGDIVEIVNDGLALFVDAGDVRFDDDVYFAAGSYKIDSNGVATLNIAADDATYTGIVTSDSGVLKYRTKANLASDIQGSINHNSLTNTHNLTTDIDHDTITNTHNLTTDIDHNQLTNTHNLTSDIDHDQLTNYNSREHIELPNNNSTGRAAVWMPFTEAFCGYTSGTVSFVKFWQHPCVALGTSSSNIARFRMDIPVPPGANKITMIKIRGRGLNSTGVKIAVYDEDSTHSGDFTPAWNYTTNLYVSGDNYMRTVDWNFTDISVIGSGTDECVTVYIQVDGNTGGGNNCYIAGAQIIFDYV